MYIVHENFLTINIIFPSTCHQDGSAAAGDVQRLVQGYTKPLLSRLSDKFVGTTSLILRGNISLLKTLWCKVRLRRAKKKNSHSCWSRWDELRSIMINFGWFHDIEILDGTSKFSPNFRWYPDQ